MESMKIKNQMTAYELMEKALVRKSMASYNAYKQVFESSATQVKAQKNLVYTNDAMRKFKKQTY